LKTKASRAAPLALAAVSALLAHAHCAAAAPSAINIPAHPLGQALNELARQAILQMTFPAAQVAGKKRGRDLRPAHRQPGAGQRFWLAAG